MKAVGIIAEYNPFHTGHSYQIAEAKKQIQADCVIAVMSGNYVQRGEPAIFDKYVRAEMALASGVDLVIELPILSAIDGASGFANGAIATLKALKNISAISFGTETDSLDVLNQLASLLVEESKEYQIALQNYIKTGEHMGLARMHAISEITGDSSLDKVLSSPNNILAIEYLMAMKKQNVSFSAHNVKRIGAGYHATDAADGFASASMLRAALTEGNLNAVRPFLSEPAYQLIQNNMHPIFAEDCSEILNYAISLQESFSEYLDMDEDLSNRLCSLKKDGSIRTFQDWVNDLKTKNQTQLHIQRALLHIILGIKKSHANAIPNIPYIQVLGMNSVGRAYLHDTKKSIEMPVITEASSASAKLDSSGRELFLLQTRGTEIYRNLVYQKYNYQIPDEFRSRPIIL